MGSGFFKQSFVQLQPQLFVAGSGLAGSLRFGHLLSSRTSYSRSAHSALSSTLPVLRRILSGLREYNYLVRVKTSITLPKELLGRLDRVDRNRSALLERAALAYLAQLEGDARDKRDIGIINRNAARLNREALDALEYQQVP
jgi:hypothetical protein